MFSFPKTRLGKINLTLSILLILLLGCFFTLFKTSRSTDQLATAVNDVSNDKLPDEKNMLTTTEKPSPFPTIKWVSEASTLDQYSITYPKTTTQSVNQALQRIALKERDAFLKSDAVNLKTVLKTTTSLHKITFIYKFTKTTANAEKTTSIAFATYDTKTNKLVKISDVLTKNELCRLSKKAQYRLIKKGLSRQQAYKLTKPTWKNFERFALSDDYIKIYYPEKTVSTEIQAITIPIHTLKSTAVATSTLKTNGKKVVAITFDDGPHVKNTPKILKVLHKHHATATFYMLGSLVEQHPDLARQVVNAGHEIGNHSYNHENLSKLSAKKALYSITKTNKIIEHATGFEPLTIRPPYGARNQAMEKKMHQPIITWNLDTLDWKTRNSQSTYAQIKRNVRPGSIILMHDIQPSTAQALDQILRYLDKKGYEYVTVSQLDF